MYRYKDVTGVHLEITSRCNASCPMCPRNLEGGAPNPLLPIAELTLDDAKAIFPDEFIRRLYYMFMCGNYGDPMVARDTLAVFEHFRAVNPKIGLWLNTNASGRDQGWWRSLAPLLKYCVFSIDGLEDTNHLYRRGTEWRRIMASVEAFIGAGGKAEWEFLVFRHNEHQIEQARELSARLGFRKFTTKRTERFIDKGLLVEHKPVRDRGGALQYRLELPRQDAYQNAALKSFDRRVRETNGYESYVAQTAVDCKALSNGKNQIYVSSEGLVFPCCWTGHLYSQDKPAGEGEIWSLLNALPGGKDAINARKRPIGEILDGPFFQEMIPNGWDRDSAGRLAVCARICGAIDMHRSMRETG